ncbi:hypothetical protein SAMN04489761_1360 [Tenacibaculum sp. MAR_2009_124]|uniref:hypothetical protein n=1 Tax=Tenacibaculum sp. MAR_2009_124 TaxID=1250059 RepID=UPI000894959E|nr:hypothetical protein [Tenacibaculum sp. MAR_2009_124]SEB66041.1 hypothetical protein SAMN04489761_1360 [Tenacibaculum sp. MAR_2009_124]
MVKNIEKSTIVLLQKIKDKIGSPVSIDVVVATLESLGIKSENVQDDFGYKDSWELAKYIFQELTLNAKSLIKNEKQLEYESLNENKPKKVILNAYLFFKQYFFSTSYLLAFAIQLTSIIAYGFSIYIYTGFNHVQSTVVVLGIVIGMIISGGFIQVIGNQVSKHFYLKDYKLVEQMTFFLLKKGAFFIISSIALLFFINLILPLYPLKTALLIGAYAFWVALLFLVFAPLHVIKNRKIILLATLLATIVCLPLTGNTFFNIYQLHFLGLFVAISTVMIFLVFYFKFKRKESLSSEIIFQKGALFYNNLYPFLYGVLINLFFFIDRIVAWSSTKVSNFFMPIYYEKDYEIGMDISIIFFLLLAGILEYGNTSLFNLLNEYKNKIVLANLKEYKRKIRKLYFKNILLVFLAALPIYLIILYIFYGNWGYNHFFIEPLKSINIKVANAGIIGYFFLCIGMLNSSYLLSMKKQKEVLQILSFACFLNITSGLILSRLFSYEDSVYGMLIASIAFTFLSLKENIKVYKNIDYYATL